MSYTNGIGNLQQVLNSIAPTATPAAESGSAQEQHKVAAANASRVDETSLSSAGGVIAQALEGSDVRAEKVSALQQAIASGTYNVSSSDVAGKMIQSLLE